jgi:cell volume regulation protein A
MAYILTIVFTGLAVNPETNPWSIIALFLRQLLLGGILGFIFGKLGSLVINKIRMDYEGLYVVLGIAIMFFSFSATNFLGGNGFLAVYLSAIYLGSCELIHKKTILKSFDSFAWLMQIVLFLTLGLLVFPSQIIPVIGIGLLISLFLMFIARPVGVFISLIPFHVQNRSRWFISWVGLRGAVPIVFATYPLLAGAEKASMIFNIVFFISVTSVLIQGTTLPVVAKWLHLTLPEKLKHRTQSDMELFDSIKSALTEITLPENCPSVGKQIVELGLPKTSYISFIVRDNKYITPTGSTTLAVNDRLFVLSENRDSLNKVFECLEMEQEYPPLHLPG